MGVGSEDRDGQLNNKQGGRVARKPIIAITKIRLYR
jgi:hypothetical protein